MTEANTLAVDNSAAEAFSERLGDILNSSAIALMLSIGHRTGLFDVMKDLPPGTSHDVAAAADLDERYVREWLAAMVTGDIVHFDGTAKTYWLPDEHAASLTRGAELGNIAVYAQLIPMAGAVQERLLDRFKNGGGLSYGEYPCFHTIMAEDSGQTVVDQLFDTVLPLAPELPAKLEQGIDVLDAGCGSGRALVAMAARYPRSRFIGYDLETDVIEKATASADEAGLTNIRFETRDLTGFDEFERYDLVTSFDAIHDQMNPQGVLQRLWIALRPGGLHLMQDVGGSADLDNNRDFPLAAFLYTVSCVHCMPVSLGQGGAGLGTMWGWETAEAMLRDAGFTSVERTVLEHDPMNVWFVSRKA